MPSRNEPEEGCTMSIAMITPKVFEGLHPVRAGFTTRSGGASTGAFASLNLGLSTGDDADAVHENRRRAARTLGFSENDLAIPGQIHGAEVLHVTEPGLFAGYDGVVTDTPGILLAISAADCAAVLLADSDTGVVGACHAGWRGAVGGVVQATVGAMTTLGADAGRLRAWISPCISVENFEVGEEVAEHFEAAQAEHIDTEENESAAPEQGRSRKPRSRVTRRTEWHRPHVDLAGFIRDRLLETGIPRAAIETSGRCTVGESDIFFSHRASGGHTGRMMGLIGLVDASREHPGPPSGART